MIWDIPNYCPWCSGVLSKVYHAGIYPKIKAIEYHPNGSVKRIEFHSGEQPRMAGMHPNAIWISDDFDDSATVTIQKL